LQLLMKSSIINVSVIYAKIEPAVWFMTMNGRRSCTETSRWHRPWRLLKIR
jgi:hypothetical protein